MEEIEEEISSFHHASRQDHCGRGPGSGGDRYAAGPYMYFIIIIYITCIRMENKE